jgi:hypothetical protein
VKIADQQGAGVWMEIQRHGRHILAACMVSRNGVSYA